MRPFFLISAALAAGLMAGAAAAEAPAPLIAQSCAGCHGQAGAGVGAVPEIAGIDPERFVRIWAEFRANERPATIMGRIARGYTDAEVAELAAYFASLK
jgi:cytochrome subunit of sulfide dehydrogenase